MFLSLEREFCTSRAPFERLNFSGPQVLQSKKCSVLHKAKALSNETTVTSCHHQVGTKRTPSKISIQHSTSLLLDSLDYGVD